MQTSNRSRELLKNSLVLSIGALAPKLLSLLTAPILTTYLSKDEYGRYDLIVSIILFVIPVITLQIQQGAFRFLVDTEDETERSRYISSAFAFVLVGNGAIALIGAALMAAWGMELPLVGLIVVLLLLEAVYMLTGQVVRGQRNAMGYSLGAVIYSAGYLLLLMLCVYWLRMGIHGVLLASCGGYLAASLFMILFAGTQRYFRRKQASMATLRQMLSFSAPIVPGSISLWVVNFLDRIIIVSMIGTEMNAVYSVATKVSALYTAVYGIFAMAWTESAVRSLKDQDVEAYYSQMFRGTFRATVGVMLALFAATPLMYRLLINSQYDSAYTHSLILYFGMFFNSMVSFYSGIYVALKRTREVGLSSVGGAVINTAVNVLMIRRFGLYAASVSTVVSFLVIALYRSIDLQRYARLQYDVREMGVGLGCMLLALGLMWNKSLTGILLCAAMAVVYNLIFNRALIMGIIKYILAFLQKTGRKKDSV